MAFDKLKEKWRNHKIMAMRLAVWRKIEKSQARYSINRAILFGSVAKGKSSKLFGIDMYAAPVSRAQYGQYRSDLEEAWGYPAGVYTDYHKSNLIKRAVEAGDVIYES
jgi:predicted nucleotidyltransferase